MALTAEQIETLLTSAKRLRTQGGERESHSISDIIDALQYLDGVTANASAASPVRLQKVKFGGAVVTGGCE